MALLLLLATPRSLPASPPSAAPQGPSLQEEPELIRFREQALAVRPELAQATAILDATREREPQAGALPDPVVALGLQNEGIESITVGKMEGSWVSLMISQSFPWYGKRDLRRQASALETSQASLALDRARLRLLADVERAYVDLLLARDQLALLSDLDSLWMQAESAARSRYETADGAQSDFIRAQLERSRLAQRRWALEAEERRRVVGLNRLLGQPLESEIATHRSLANLPDPPLADPAGAVEEAERQSPELRGSRLAIEQADRLSDLARKGYYPDVTMNAGWMPRGGGFDPMWQAGLSFSVPIWAGQKQAHEVEESQLRGVAAQQGAEALQALLRQRVTERLAILASLIQTCRLYRTELLALSDAAVTSTLAQYQVGRVNFAQVLEALTGYVADVGAFYESVASAQRLDIAQREISLDEAPSPGLGGMGGQPLPGAGVMSAAPASGGAMPSPRNAASQPSGSSQGGM